jgi:hypothetical protein
MNEDVSAMRRAIVNVGIWEKIAGKLQSSNECESAKKYEESKEGMQREKERKQKKAPQVAQNEKENTSPEEHTAR